MAYGVGVTKRNVSGVICAQASTANRDAMTMALAACQIEYVARDHIFVRVVGPHSIGRVNRFIIKAFQINRVRAVDRDFTCIDIAAHRVGQPKS